MQNIHWDQVFPGEIPGNGATEPELQAFVAALAQPVSHEEVETISAAKTDPEVAENKQPPHRHTDPQSWRLPAKPLPPAYLSFLRWSNGGSFYNGARGFNFLSTSTVRSFALGYRLPERMPGSLPFAFDGDNNFYVFDMRSDPVNGEYPILLVRAEDMRFDDAVHVANSFVEACEGKTNPALRLKD
jgi:hypothetical protein